MSERKVIKYLAVYEYEHDRLNHKVNHHLKEGMELYGSISVTNCYDGDGMAYQLYVQPMVEYDV